MYIIDRYIFALSQYNYICVISAVKSILGAVQYNTTGAIQC